MKTSLAKRVNPLGHYRRFLFDPGINRWFGFHNPFGSKAGKAVDPYINGITLNRLLCHTNPKIGDRAIDNALKRQIKLEGVESTRLRRYLRFILLRPNFDKLVAVQAWEDLSGNRIDPLPYMQRLTKLTARRKDREGVRLINRAFFLAWYEHMHVLRKDGKTPFFEHVFASAEMVAEAGLDAEGIAAAFCHDLREDARIGDQKITKEFLEKYLNQNVANIVEGVTELGQEPEYKGQKPSLVDIYRKFLEYGNKDLRSLIVKIVGDRKHNMLTLEYLERSVRKKKADETLNVYARIADGLGMWESKRELEDLSFKHLEPEVYQSIEIRRSEIIKASEQKIKEIIRKMEEGLAASKIKARIVPERRFIYELFQRMEKRNISLEELSPTDIWRFNIVVPEGSNCYDLLSWVHGEADKKYSPAQGEMRDYIAEPRPNGHKFLQTYVEIPSFGRLLVQIRDEAMYDNYRRGILSLSERKEKWYKEDQAWLMAVLNHLKEEGVSEGEAYRVIAAYSDPINVYTLKGKQIELPFGATGLDFAREIHEEIFLHAKRVIVNDREVKLSRVLSNGDTVFVETDGSGPTLDWLDLVHTSDARSSLRRKLRRRSKTKIREDALLVLNREGERFHLSAEDLIKTIFFRKYVSAFSFKGLNKLEKPITTKERGYRRLRKKYLQLEDKLKGIDRGKLPEVERELLERRTELEKMKAEIRKLRETLMEKRIEAFLWQIGVGERRAGEAASEIHALYLKELDKHEKKRLKLAPYYLSVETMDRKGLLKKLSSPLEKLGFNIRDSFPVYSGEGKVIIVLGVDVFGGRRGGGMIGQLQRFQARTIAQNIATQAGEEVKVSVLEPADVVKYLKMKTEGMKFNV